MEDATATPCVLPLLLVANTPDDDGVFMEGDADDCGISNNKSRQIIARTESNSSPPRCLHFCRHHAK
jgi:hypothetical protein